MNMWWFIVRVGGGVVVGVVIKGVDVYVMFGIGIMVSDVLGDGSGIVFGFLFEDNGVGDFGVIMDDSNYIFLVLVIVCLGIKVFLYWVVFVGFS